MATVSFSEPKICSLALSHIGASGIESLSEGSSEAQACDLWYDFSRRQTLAIMDWSFARRRIILATHNDDPPDEWAFRYQYPSDCIKMRLLENPLGTLVAPVPFKIESSDDTTTKTIMTNLETAKGIYTFNLVIVAQFSEMFIELLSYAIAGHIAFSVTGKDKLQQVMEDRFLRLTRSAPAIDAAEDMQEGPKDADWISGRT